MNESINQLCLTRETLNSLLRLTNLWPSDSRSNWNLEMLVFEERENRSTRRETSRSKDENQQQTQPTYDAESGNRTQATLVGGECSQHCAIPASQCLPSRNIHCATLQLLSGDSCMITAE